MSPFEIEAKAALTAVKRCLSVMQSSCIILEGDCKELILALTQPMRMDDIDVVMDTKQKLLDFVDVKVMHTWREGNKNAHWLVKEAAKLKRNLHYSLSSPMKFYDMLRKVANDVLYERS